MSGNCQAHDASAHGDEAASALQPGVLCACAALSSAMCALPRVPAPFLAPRCLLMLRAGTRRA